MNAPQSAFRPATRSEAKPLIGLYAESGAGKTWSALLLARGFVGPNGKIGMIETEGGRGEANVGREPVGQFLVRPIRGSFSPEEYGKAITEAEGAGLDALIIDSASHEWEGAGGVLSMAADNQAKGVKGVLVWQQPKISHQRNFMLRLMQTPIALVIVCMRAKYPMEKKGSDWVRSTVLEPKQADDILFEMFVHGWIDQAHNLHVTKYTLPELATVIEDGKPISIETGRALATWAKGGTPSDHSRAGAEPSLAPPTKSSPRQDSEALGPNSGFDSRDGGQPSDEPDSELVRQWDEQLTTAAQISTTVLQATWSSVPKAVKKVLKTALDERYKPAAEAKAKTPA